MKMTEAFWPSIILSETHAPNRDEKGVLADALTKVADEGFYEGAEITHISDPADRKRIGEIVRARNLILSIWYAPLFDQERLDLASVDEALRRKSVSRLKELVESAAECGVRNFGLMAGRDPGPGKRAEATEQVYNSLCEIAEALKAYPPMRILIENFDRGAHKDGLMGPTNEVVALIRKVRQSYPDTSLNWDSSHTALNFEDLVESLAASHTIIGHLHLANPVIDRSRPDFGDYHIAPGPPGILDVELSAAIFRQAIKLGIFGPKRPGVGTEIRTAPGGDPWKTAAVGRQLVARAWELATTQEA